jgi:hypothetical protein
MPYVSASDYSRVRHLIRPELEADNPSALRRMEADIYALNKRIRSLPGSGPTPIWRELMERHRRLLEVYRENGGQRL